MALTRRGPGRVAQAPAPAYIASEWWEILGRNTHAQDQCWAYTTTASAAVIAAIVAASALQPAEAQQRKSLRWTTSQVGSYGYTIAASMAKIVEQALGGEYTVTVQPYTSPTVAMKAVMNGEGEIAYTADIGMTQFHERVGGFKDYKPTKPELVHTWYAYPMESMMATSAKDADKFKCWKDFSGKPVFYTQAGFMNWLNWQRIYKALGYDFKHVQIDLKSNADALEAGTIVGSATYTTAGRSLAAYWKETEIRMDIKVVNPCPDEVAKLKAAGLAVAERRSEGRVHQGRRPDDAAGRADPVRLQRPDRYAGGRRLQDGQGVLRQEGRAGEDRSGLLADGEGLRRHAGAGHQRQSGDRRCIRAWPSSSRSTRPGTTSGRSRPARADRLTASGGAGTRSRRALPAYRVPLRAGSMAGQPAALTSGAAMCAGRT